MEFVAPRCDFQTLKALRLVDNETNNITKEIFANRVDWDITIEHIIDNPYQIDDQKKAECFIRQFKDQGDFDLSWLQQLIMFSEEFLRDYADEFDWSYIFSDYNLSPEFREEFKDRIV
jgi:hypothetical protein